MPSSVRMTASEPRAADFVRMELCILAVSVTRKPWTVTVPNSINGRAGTVFRISTSFGLVGLWNPLAVLVTSTTAHPERSAKSKRGQALIIDI